MEPELELRIRERAYAIWEGGPAKHAPPTDGRKAVLTSIG